MTPLQDTDDLLDEYRRSQQSGGRVSGGGDLLDEYQQSRTPGPTVPLRMAPVVVRPPAPQLPREQLLAGMRNVGLTVEQPTPIARPAPVVPDATQTRDTSVPAVPQNVGERAALGVIGTVANPVGTVRSMVQSAITANRAAAENDAAASVGLAGGNPTVVPRTVTPEQARDAATQTATILALPIAGEVEGIAGRAMAPVVGSRAAGAIARVGTSAAYGAGFAPQDPGAGALAGGVFGAISEAASPSLPRGRRLVTRDPNRMLSDETAPRAPTATGRIVQPRTVPEGPDYTVEANEPPRAPNRPAGATEEPQAPAPVKAPAAAPARQGEPTGDLLNEYQQSQVGERERVNNATAQRGEQATFPMTAQHLVDHAETKGTTIAQSADALRAAGYTVSPELEREAVKQRMQQVATPAPAPAKMPAPHEMSAKELADEYDRAEEAGETERASAIGDEIDRRHGARSNVPEKTDLFGKPVEPTVEQGGLFGAGTGTQLQRDELKQLGRKDQAITPEEMRDRRDVLGAPKPVGKSAPESVEKSKAVGKPAAESEAPLLTPRQRQYAAQRGARQETGTLWDSDATRSYMELRERHEDAAIAGDTKAGATLRRQHQDLLRKMTKEQRVQATQWWYTQAADGVEDARASGNADEMRVAKAARTRAQLEVTAARKLNDMDTAIDAEQYGQKRKKLPTSTEGEVDASRYRQTTVSPAEEEPAAPKRKASTKPAKVQEGSRYEGDENPEALAAASKQQARGHLNARLAFEAKMNAPEYAKLPAKRKKEIYDAFKSASDLFDATTSEMSDAFGPARAEKMRRELLAEAKRAATPAPEPTKAKKPSRKKVENFINPKYRLDTHDDLYRRAAELEQRIQEYGSGEHGSAQWVRDAVDLTKPVSGFTSVQHRMVQDAEIYKSVLEELRGRLGKEGMSAEDAEDVIDENIGKHATPPASATDFDPDEFMSHQRTGEGTVGAGFDKSIFKKLGANLYRGDIASVAVKEGLQNAVDALRGLGKDKRGVITIHIDEKQRQVKISDTGVGMLPDVAANEFMDIGGSLKGEGASGGFGLAKVGLLASTRHFELRTVAGGERQGFSRQTKILTIIEGSGEDWANGTLKFHTQEVANDTPTGSTLDLRFEDAAKVSAYQAGQYIARASHFSRLPYTIEATARDSYSDQRKVLAPVSDADHKWNNLNTMKPDPIIRFEVPGARAEVYESQETGPFMGSADVHILNNGLYQFSISKMVGETGPKTLVIDVHPTASIDSSEYPFTTNREQLKGAIENRLSDLASELRNAAGKREIETLVNTMSQAPKIRARFPELANLDQRVVDTSGQVPSTLLQQIAKRRYAAELSDLSERAMQEIVEVISKFRQFDPPVFGGLSTSKGYLGVNLNARALNEAARQILGTEFTKSEKNPFRGGNIILYNPWTTFTESRSRIENGAPAYGDAWAQHLADQWFGTMAHEVVHQLERGHEVGFAGTLTRVMSALGRMQGRWLEEADQFFDKLLSAEHGHYEEFLADYNALKGYWSKGDDLFKKFSDEESTEGTGGVDGDDSGRDAMAEQSRAPRRGGAGGGSERHADRGSVPRSARAGQAGGPVAGTGAQGAPRGSAGGGGSAGAGGAVGSAAGHPTPDAPGLEGHRASIRPLEIVRAIKQLLNPESLGAEARGAAGTIGHESALSWRQITIANEALRDFSRLVGKKTKAESVKLWDAAEHGRSTGDPVIDQGNALLHQITEQYTQQLLALDKLKSAATIDNYIGRFWAQPHRSIGDVLSIIRGKRPFEGPKSFTKHRSLLNFTDGLDAGLVPQTYNYVDAQLAKIAEMQRVIAAERMLRQEQEFGRAKKVMTSMGHEPPVDAEGEKWVRIDREGNDPAFTVYLPPEVGHWEAVDTVVYGKLQALVKQLNVLHHRAPKIGRQALGYAEGDRQITTKFGGAEGVISHELGHILDARYGLRQQIEAGIGKAPRRVATQGKKAGQSVPDYSKETPEERTRRKDLREELRQLANLRRETMQGVPATKDLQAGDKKYLHSWPEKMANMVEAYIHARPRFKKVAPGIFKIFDGIVQQHPELHALRGIEPSLSREEHTATERLPGFPIGGYWYAPRNAAAVWRNHLSRGLRGNPLYDAFMAPTQAAQQMLLGLSGFHATVISTEGAFSELALGAENFINAGGKASQGIRHVGTAGVSPAVTSRLGRQVMQEFRRPGTHPQLAQVLDAMIAGGFRGKATSDVWTGERIEKFRKALNETLHNDSTARRLLAASKLPFNTVWAAIETTAIPVLAKYVPFMKTGALYTAAAEKVATLKAQYKNDVPVEVLRREMRDLVKEMDYRFGQVDYDNFFINNAVKNLAQMVFLAPGWTFGTVALAVRGASDIAALPKRAFDRIQHARGKGAPDTPPPELLGKSAAYWIFGAVLGTAIINGVLTYLHTGETPEGKDFWAFRDGTRDRDGNWNRQTIPGYLMKDVYDWSHHAVDTFRNKLSPMLSFIGRLAVNRTYSGDEIYDEQAPRATKLKQLGRELLKETSPLSVQNYLESRRRNEGVASSATRNVFGVTPAKREFQRTDAQNLMNEILTRRGHTARTPDERAQAEDRYQLREDLRSGAKTKADAKEAEQHGDITRRQRINMLRTSKENPLVSKFKQLTPAEARQVWQKAEPWERELWNKVYRYKDRQFRRDSTRISRVAP